MVVSKKNGARCAELNLLMLLAVVLAMLGFAPGASAATVEVSGSQLLLVDGSSASDINVSETAGEYVFNDGTTAGPGCTQISPAQASCPIAGLTDYLAELGDGGDTFRWEPSTTPIGGTVVGGPGDDFVVGNDAAEKLQGNAGDDRLDGRGGGNTIFGEIGEDVLFLSGSAGEVLSGGDGLDTARWGLEYTPGTLSLDGVANDGVLFFGAANLGTDIENLTGGFASDYLEGDSGPNYLLSNGGSDVMYGLGGDDYLRAIRHDPADSLQLFGGDGNDYLAAGSGNDLLVGADGDDTLLPLLGDDELSGGPGRDTANYADGVHQTDLVLTIGDGPNDGALNEFDDIQADIENIVGGSANDLIVGSAEANSLTGAEGQDRIFGLDSNDSLFGDFATDGSSDELYGGDGDDSLSGGEAADLLDGGSGGDLIDGETGVDTVDYSSRIAAVTVTLGDEAPNDGEAVEADLVIATENVLGGFGDDSLTGAPVVANLLNGAAGDDVFHATDGISDEIVCGPGIDDATDTDAIDVLTDCEAAVATELQTQIDGGPDQGSTVFDDEVVFEFSTTNGPGDTTFECQIDGGAWNPCESGDSFGPLENGAHNFAVAAQSNDPNFSDDSTPATREFNTSVTEMDTSITSGPGQGETVTENTVTFTYSATPPINEGGNYHYECRLDGGAWTNCSKDLVACGMGCPIGGEITYNGLSEGPHSFEVVAIAEHPSLRSDPSPASRDFVYEPAPDPDPVELQTQIDDAPPASTDSTTASFEFSSPNGPADGTGFECRLDGVMWFACQSPQEFPALDPGEHTFEVRAIANGNPGFSDDPTPASHTWTITGPPVNQAPIANAISEREDRNNYRLDGSLSTDADGQIVSHNWFYKDQLISTKAAFRISFTSGGKRTFRLVVTDNDGATDQTTITVSPRIKMRIVLGGEVNFKFDRAELTRRAKATLRVLRESVAGAKKLNVVGYASDEPWMNFPNVSRAVEEQTERYNQRLSERRAVAVFQFLYKRIIPATEPESIRVEGRGERNHIGSIYSARDRARSRRVVITIVREG